MPTGDRHPGRPTQTRFLPPLPADDSSVAPSETVPTASPTGAVSFISEAVARGTHSFSRVSSPVESNGTSIVNVISCCESGLPRIQQT